MRGLTSTVRNLILVLFWTLLALFCFSILTMFFDYLADSVLGAVVPEPFFL